MIRNRNLSLDAAARQAVLAEVDGSAASANQIAVAAIDRSIYVQSIKAICTEDSGTFAHTANVGVINATTTDVDAFGAVALAAFDLGTVRNIITTPFKLDTGEVLTVGHTQTAGAGKWVPVVSFVFADESHQKADVSPT